MIRDIYEIFKFIAIVALIVAPIRFFVAQPFIVQGSSMSPTFENSDYLVIDELSYRFREPKRGEMIVFKYPLDSSKFFIKRIVGLPGENIRMENNKIFIQKDGLPEQELEEKYFKSPALTLAGNKNKWSLNQNEYFVLGDNRSNSSDSRYFGLLDKKFIIGRAWLRLWPLNEIDYLPGYYKFKI
ncbi:MAG: signal peptidase I [Candidatus Niyogibacteria bacterium RIFCSPLOWO2_12_FULL_41_13]|uniref:Signal peptidase I n=1 Tax=Candidatus Niyogibacteria bacterium RIFCSPLOWO2_12_FULL_41_13 TaxID=1801726 RepID=A0A1G2F3H4_9BACT|nr:MAG: signal peptidase I [Candidatus Niyogibacteria bacterium RIFCSPLOWO2_12_FULL_41_13]